MQQFYKVGTQQNLNNSANLHQYVIKQTRNIAKQQKLTVMAVLSQQIMVLQHNNNSTNPFHNLLLTQN